MEEKKKAIDKKTILIISSIIIVTIIIVSCFLLFRNTNENTTVSDNNDNNLNTSMENEKQQQYIQIDGGLEGLIGKTQEEVTTIIEKAGLKVKINEEKEFSDTIPSGYVISCSGSRATGKWHYKIDELDSTQIAIIKNSMKYERDKYNLFMYEKIYEYEKLTDNNLVLGDTLYLTISKGKEVIMPNLIGRNQNEAKQILLENNLQYKEIIGSDVDKLENTVLEQSIEEKESVEEKTEVEVTINKLQKLSIDISSMTTGNEPVPVRLEFDDPSQGTRLFTDITPSEKNLQCLIKLGKKTKITVYINGNNIYSTTINPNGAKDIIYIKNPNPVEEKILDIY